MCYTVGGTQAEAVQEQGAEGYRPSEGANIRGLEKTAQ